MLTRRPLFAFAYSMVAQLRSPFPWSPIFDSSMCWPILDTSARRPPRCPRATRRGTASLTPTAWCRWSEFGSKGKIESLEQVFRRRLDWVLRYGVGYEHVDVRPDGFVRVQHIVCPRRWRSPPMLTSLQLSLPRFYKCNAPFFRKLVRSDHLKRFELRFELCERSGYKEWFIRLAKGEMKIPVKVCVPSLLHQIPL